jgi:hypothetical protein
LIDEPSFIGRAIPAWLDGARSDWLVMDVLIGQTATIPFIDGHSLLARYYWAV